MLCSMLPGPGSWLAGSSAAPQSVLPWPPQLGDPGAATRDEAAQITALPAARAGCELRSRPRSHTRPQSTATGRGAAGSPGRAQARTRTEAPSPAGKPISTPSLPRGTRRPNPWSRLQHTLTPPLIFTVTRPPSDYSLSGQASILSLAFAFSPTLCGSPSARLPVFTPSG